MNPRLTHDTAVAMAQAILDSVKPCLREEEWQSAYEEFYVIAKAGIEAMCIMEDRMQRRLKPGRN